MAAIQAVGERGLGIEGVHVHVRNGPPAEHHWVADIRRDVFSISKTFTSVAVGIAQAQGLLDVDDAALDHLGHLVPAAAPGVDAITIRHLLTCRRGSSTAGTTQTAITPGTLPATS